MTTIPVTYPLVLGAALFGLGLYGALTQRNAIRILMCVELMLNAVNINLVAFAATLRDAAAAGQIFALFIMTVAAAEVALALAIILILARREKHIDIERVHLLRW
ncbi:MAG: NADH-quinone oxidoreductase subunit K [Firmicutes bacterium ZCTH02-B6]|nr:MAG: NADH-quinone oxidoreductase subunit K [Firmicutes bacterium ZCTH02-B6]